MSAAEPIQEQRAEPHSSALLRPAQRRAVLLGMMAGVSLAAIDQMVLSTAVSAIAAEFGDISQAPWVFTANLLTSAASMPIWGKLGDLYGRRRVFQSAISLFIVASLLAAMSDSMAWLLVCRALQGLGGGALLTIPYAILGDIIPPRERTAYVAFITVVWTTAGFIGPPLGGFLVEGPGWRWMFYLNVPAALIAFTLIQWGYRIPRQRIDHRIDFLGAGLLFSAVGALILYTSWAGESIGWGAPVPLCMIGASAILGTGFILQERRAAEPIVQLSIFSIPAVWAPLLATCLFGFVNFSIAFFLPLYSLAVRGTDAVQAGFTLAPLTGGMLVAGLIVGRRAAATGRYRRYATLALAIYTTGLALFATVDRNTPTIQFLSYSLLLGLGSGTLGPVVIASLQNAVDEKHLGVVSSLPGFSRAIAQTIGTSILGTLLAARIAAHLRTDVAPTAGPGIDLAEFIARPAAVRDLAEPLQAAVIEAYRSAFAETFLTMVVIACLSLIATRFMVDPTD
jgi:EmrB/QacA subfamily drug resistance transporter